ncbi:MAG: DUF6249 domain-containing protein [Gammaproteobacteria bacterium]|nr:hypothetical protein [Pseudomonadales bacterium]MCP5349080.1 hypothetical protein [Pseudomonadales bacterium]
MYADALIAITAILVSASAFGGFLYYLYKAKTSKLQTLVKMAELGGSGIDAETIRLLGNTGSGYKQDLKVGIIWLAIGIPLTLHILFEEPTGVFAALIPVFIGIAYLISGKYRLREPD